MKKLIIIAVSLLVTTYASGQIITTIAGNHALGGGYTGNGGPATSAQLSEPSGIVIDASGNLYIADAGNNVIRVVNTSGVINHFAGNITGVDTCCGVGDGGPANVAQLKSPVGITFDPSGNIYITDVGNYRVRRINTSNTITTTAGTGIEAVSCDTLNGVTATTTKIYCTGGIAVDTSGNVIFNTGYRTTKMIKVALGLMNTFSGYCYYGGLNFGGDGGLADTALFSNAVWGIAVDKYGNVYISDYDNDNIRKVNPSGIISTIAGIAGVVGYSGDGGPATAAQLAGPVGLAVDAIGNLYIADQNNNVIRKVDTSGIITTVAGNVTVGMTYSGDGGSATSAGLFNPYGVAIDALGNLYISDWGNNVIRKVTYHTAGISNLQNKVSEVNIYPNPAKTNITITDQDKVFQITISDLLGQVVYSQEYNNEQVNVNIADLSNGLYFIKINGSVVKKFVKE